jgi:hypothetical protein
LGNRTIVILALLCHPFVAANSALAGELVFGGGAGYFFQDAGGDILRDDTPELTWNVGFDFRFRRMEVGYDLAVEPDYVYKPPDSPFDPFPNVTAYHHVLTLRWYYLVRSPAAFSVAACATCDDVRAIDGPTPEDYNRVHTSLWPGAYVGCVLRPLSRLTTSLEVGFIKRVKPTRRTGDPYGAAFVLSNTWASRLDAEYWFWGFFGAKVRASLFVDGPGEPLDDERYEKVDYPPARGFAVFVGPTVNVTAFGRYF